MTGVRPTPLSRARVLAAKAASAINQTVACITAQGPRTPRAARSPPDGRMGSNDRRIAATRAVSRLAILGGVRPSFGAPSSRRV